MCHNKQCIQEKTVCDSKRNCFDKSDENCHHEDAIDDRFSKSR